MIKIAKLFQQDDVITVPVNKLSFHLIEQIMFVI